MTRTLMTREQALEREYQAVIAATYLAHARNVLREMKRPDLATEIQAIIKKMDGAKRHARRVIDMTEGL